MIVQDTQASSVLLLLKTAKSSWSELSLLWPGKAPRLQASLVVQSSQLHLFGHMTHTVIEDTQVFKASLCVHSSQLTLVICVWLLLASKSLGAQDFLAHWCSRTLSSVAVLKD